MITSRPETSCLTALRGFSLRADSVSSGEEAIQEVVSADSQDPYRWC